MKTTVVRAASLAPDHLARWRALQDGDASLSSPFLSPEFTQAVALVRDDVEVGIMQMAGGAVGFFPFQRGPFSLGEPVGGWINDLHGVIAAAEADWSPMQLLRDCGLIRWRFTRLLACQRAFAPFHCRRHASGIMDLSQGFDAYLAQRRACGIKHRKIRQLARRLERDFGPVRFEFHCADPRAIAALMRWKFDRYGRQGYEDVFAIPWIRALVTKVHSLQTSRFGGVLSLLHAGDALVAGYLGMRSQSALHAWFAAYNPNFAGYSPGMILMLKIAEGASAAGLQTIELGGYDDYHYKRRLMSRSITLADGSVDRLPGMLFARQARRSTEQWIRSSAVLRPPARMIVRTLRGLKQILR